MTKWIKPKKIMQFEDNGWRKLGDVIPNADIFLGCSAAGALTQDMVKTMAAHPIILALANPNPENYSARSESGSS